MTSFRARFVTACQQLLALAVVLAMLAPASRVVTLDVVGTGPDVATVARPAAAHGGVHRGGGEVVTRADGSREASCPRGAADRCRRIVGRPRGSDRGDRR